MEIFLMNLVMFLLILITMLLTYILPITIGTLMAIIYFSKIGLAGYYIVWTPPNEPISGVLAFIFLFIMFIWDLILWRDGLRGKQ